MRRNSVLTLMFGGVCCSVTLRLPTLALTLTLIFLLPLSLTLTLILTLPFTLIQILYPRRPIITNVSRALGDCYSMVFLRLF